VWDWYLASISKEEQVQERVEHAVTEAVKKRPRTDEELAELRVYMRNYLLDYRARFEESRRHFFMIDLFAGNDARFNLVLKLADDQAPVVEI
jgi:uncharacterized protein YnzC (UPF0291/DUF896 family)